MGGEVGRAWLSPKHKELRRMIVHISTTTKSRDHYTSRFLKPHPSVATTVARAVDRDRVLALNEESLKAYFDDLEDCIRRNKILPGMLDFDEKGFPMGRGEEE